MTNTLFGNRVSESVNNVSNPQTYRSYLRSRFGINSDQLNDFLSVHHDNLFVNDLNLAQLAHTWGTPLEVGYNPLVTRQIHNMQNYFATAFRKLNYGGKFTYCYASKAAQYEDLIRTALAAGANYETSSPMDIQMARLHFKAGNLPADRVVLANGFKTPQYIANLLALRSDGFQNVIPIIESEGELEAFAATGVDFEVGIRLKVDRSILNSGRFDDVTSRFGIAHAQMHAITERIAATPNLTPIMYHAMIDTQCIDRAEWVRALLLCFRQYCELKSEFPTLRAFNFGGGMPVSYSLDMHFDYQAFADELTEGIKVLCAEFGIAHPEIIGEFGRYTAAAYGFDIYKVVVSKPSHDPNVDWYVLNGSLMSSLPDTWALKQKFIILPLNGFDRPCKRVWLAGLTCDSDDVYQSGEDDGTVMLPEMADGEELIIGVFMTGAYQDLLSGIGGVHHCLLPEPTELVIEADAKGGYIYRCTQPAQSLEAMASLLGYDKYLHLIEKGNTPVQPVPVVAPVPVIQPEKPRGIFKSFGRTRKRPFIPASAALAARS